MIERQLKQYFSYIVASKLYIDTLQQMETFIVKKKDRKCSSKFAITCYYVLIERIWMKKNTRLSTFTLFTQIKVKEQPLWLLFYFSQWLKQVPMFSTKSVHLP